MFIDRTKNCDDIEVMDEGITIIAHDSTDEKVIVPYSDLEWRNPYEGGDDYDLPLFLTLSEIREQLLSKKYKPVFYVWAEQDLSGTIYQHGNYSEFSHWTEHRN